MKIFSATQIHACDAYTIQAAGISSLQLMERAASRCVTWLTEHLPKDSLFVVLAGSGNNGGDGLAIARMLHQRGYGVKAFLLQINKELSPDCAANLQRLQSIDMDLVGFVAPDNFITDIPKQIVIIDAILGTGLNRPVNGWLAAFIKHVNTLPNHKISIDMPSGLSADSIQASDDNTVMAQDTLSFQFYKRCFLHPEAATFCGNVHLIDIGLDINFIDGTHTNYHTLDKNKVVQIYKPRKPHAHKGDCGSVLLVGGEYGKIGAVTLSAKAAMRAGAGLVTMLVPGCGYNIVQISAPEAMCRTSGERAMQKIDGWEQANAIGIGPGMGISADTILALSSFLDACNKPVVIDADALNIIGQYPELLAKVPAGSILTPHPKEFSRIFGENTNSMVRVDSARIQAMRYNINIVLKGHHTAIINADGECYYNMTGNAGMATGGAGDVLTGIITGLLAQGYKPYDAALLGVYLHGMAGDIAATEISQEALIAGDIINYLGKAFIRLHER